MKRDIHKPVIKSDSQINVMLAVFKTVGDTTWRMFVPVILGGLIGLWIDDSQGTRWAAVIGAVIGLVLAGFLVWRQYVSVTRDEL